MVALKTLQVLSLSVIPNRSYESLKLKIVCVNYARFHKSSHIGAI